MVSRMVSRMVSGRVTRRAAGETGWVGGGLDRALLLDVVAGVGLLHIHLRVKRGRENHGFAVDHVRTLLDHVVHAGTVAEENEAEATAVAVVMVIHDAGVLDLSELAKVLLQITCRSKEERDATVRRVCAKSANENLARDWLCLLFTYDQA